MLKKKKDLKDVGRASRKSHILIALIEDSSQRLASLRPRKKIYIVKQACDTFRSRSLWCPSQRPRQLP